MLTPRSRCGAAGSVSAVLVAFYGDCVVAGAFYIDGSVTAFYGNCVAICIFDCSGIA